MIFVRHAQHLVNDQRGHGHREGGQKIDRLRFLQHFLENLIDDLLNIGSHFFGFRRSEIFGDHSAMARVFGRIHVDESRFARSCSGFATGTGLRKSGMRSDFAETRVRQHFRHIGMPSDQPNEIAVPHSRSDNRLFFAKLRVIRRRTKRRRSGHGEIRN